MKITDYGLATNTYNRGYVTVRHETRPIRYMSEEALEKDRFSEASDVWAFGVTCWECLTLGKIPYFERDDRQLITFVCAGGRLSREQIQCDCPNALWDLIVRCWSKAAKDRPKFSDLVIELQAIRAETSETKPIEADTNALHSNVEELTSKVSTLQSAGLSDEAVASFEACLNCIKTLETQVEALQAKVAKAQDLQKEQESVQVRLVSVRADLEQDLKETKEELEEVIKKKTDDIESNVNFRLNQLKLDEVIQCKYICLYKYLRTY